MKTADKKHLFTGDWVGVAYEIDGKLIFPTRSSIETLSLSRAIYKMRPEIVCLEWVCDFELWRSFHRN